MASRIEVLPIGNIVANVRENVPEPVTITVTASPRQGIGATIGVAEDIAELGHTAVPHLSARLIRDSGQLQEILTRLERAGITEAFIVGGDAEAPVGEFSSGNELLTAADAIGHHLRIGIPGYPEGHPLIDAAELDRALEEKAPRADYLVTQMCFDPRAIQTWLRHVRGRGVDLPVYAGVPGPIGAMKLLRISAKVGVGESLRVLKSHRGLTHLASPTWEPTELVRELLGAARDSGSRFAGLHVYSFNDVAAAYQWHPGGEPE